MSKLHDALSALRPTAYSDVPIDKLATYLRDTFAQAELILNSVPPPPDGDDFSTARRTRTALESAANASEITASRVRPPPPDAAYAELQKEWGRPLKLNARDNKLDVSVYKMAGHDRHGTWFARRSVHEGLGFAKWKRAMQAEFSESLVVQRGPGEGSVRGIGGDTVLEREEVEGVGRLEVYALSAKFPAPTSPRDFVTMLLTTENGLSELSAVKVADGNGETVIPRSYMVVSIPVDHPDGPPRSGLVRGQYESVEMIREIPLAPSTSQSTTSLPDSAEDTPNEPYPESDPELNPVEWIMVTRSNPGGGIPRFLVDRGTPPSITADAVKFLDWACARPDFSDAGCEKEGERAPGQDNCPRSHSSFHQSNAAGVNNDVGRPILARDPDPEPEPDVQDQKQSNAASAVERHIPGTFPSAKSDEQTDSQDASDTLSLDSFASAKACQTANDDAHDGDPTLLNSCAPDSSNPDSSTISHESEHSRDSTSSPAASHKTGKAGMTRREKELTRIDAKKRRLDAKLAAWREKQEKAAKLASAKTEGDAIKARERHERELKKQEDKHARELRRLEERREKELRKAEARKKKDEEEDRLAGAQRERDEWRAKAKVFGEENGILRQRMAELERENAMLVEKLGRLDGGGGVSDGLGEELRGTSLGCRTSKASRDSSTS